MSDHLVLMLAGQDDGEAVYVADALATRGVRVAWFDTAWFPADADISVRLRDGGWDGEIGTPGGTVRLGDVTAVYYRQSQPFTFPRTLSAPERRFATVEARFGFGGVFIGYLQRGNPVLQGGEEARSDTAFWPPGFVVGGRYVAGRVPVPAVSDPYPGGGAAGALLACPVRVESCCGTACLVDAAARSRAGVCRAGPPAH